MRRASAASAEARCSENCSWSFPQLPISRFRKCLILLRGNLGAHLPWAQVVVSSNLAAPTKTSNELAESEAIASGMSTRMSTWTPERPPALSGLKQRDVANSLPLSNSHRLRRSGHRNDANSFTLSDRRSN